MTTSDMPISLDRQSATSAFVLVTMAKQLGQDERTQYGGMAHRLPILIRTAGLAQALAFAKSRKKTGIDRLLDDIATTVGENDLAAKARNEQDLMQYMLLTRRTLAALVWYKRFAISVLNIDASDDVPDGNSNE